MYVIVTGTSDYIIAGSSSLHTQMSWQLGPLVAPNQLEALLWKSRGDPENCCRRHRDRLLCQCLLKQLSGHKLCHRYWHMLGHQLPRALVPVLIWSRQIRIGKALLSITVSSEYPFMCVLWKKVPELFRQFFHEFWKNYNLGSWKNSSELYLVEK
jgi:hypothetical protein